MSPRWLFGSLALLSVACADDSTAGSGGATDCATETDTAGSDNGDAPDGTAGGCSGPFEITCPADVAVECTAVETMVSVEPPAAACDVWTVTGEGEGAYGVGDSEVEFFMEGEGMNDSCTTTVTVTDTVAPEVTCPAMEVLVRPDPEAVVTAPMATVADACSDAPATANPAELPTGTTEVDYEATDAAGNVGQCSVEVAVIDVFAAPHFQVLDGTLLASGETEVTFGWEPIASTFVSGYRLEVAVSVDGPWTEVATLGPTEQLHTMELVEDAAVYRLVTTSAAGDGGATEAAPAHRIADELYDLRDVTVPTVPFPTTLYGVVRHPVALGEGPFPLVAMLHGNHGNCRDAPEGPLDYCSTSNDHECAFGAFTTPNAEGLSYAAETLAAQGIVAVSISGNAMNCRDDYIFERAQLIGEHLRRWRDWNAGDGALGGLFAGALDLSQVGLFGHSRGGDAVSNTPAVLEATPIPGVEVRSVFSLAPTDFHQVEVRDTNLAVLLPSCDGDVFDLQGMRHYDRATEYDDGVHQSQLFFIGANHNFFNTEWLQNDYAFQSNDPFCLPEDAFLMQVQQRGLSAMLGPWFSSTLADEAPVAYQRGEGMAPTAYGLHAGDDLDWRWSYSAAERVVIDDFAGAGAPAVNALGGNNTFIDWLVAQRCIGTNCDAAFLHDQWAMRLLYDESNPGPLASLSLEGLDASGADALSFRIVSRVSTLNTGLQSQEFTIRIVDANGDASSLLLSNLKDVRHLYGQNFVREILETVRIPTVAITIANPDVDLGALQTLELEMTAQPTGSVLLTDFELTSG
ncbi:MAG: HYR domain-containing protein [Myxococcota bacterium]